MCLGGTLLFLGRIQKNRGGGGYFWGPVGGGGQKSSLRYNIIKARPHNWISCGY